MRSKQKVRSQPFHLRESARKLNVNLKGTETELTVTNELNCTVCSMPPKCISVIFVEEFKEKVKFSEYFFSGETEYSQTNATDRWNL